MSILSLKSHSRKKFKNHFLNQVHCEIRFNGNFTEQVVNSSVAILNALKPFGFESVRPVVEGQFSFSAGEQGSPPTVKNTARTIGIHVISQSPRKEVQILGDKIVFSDFSYYGFEEFNELFGNITNEISKIIAFKQVNKVGLRKINAVKIAPVSSFQDACTIFNSSIFSTIRTGLVVDESLSFNEEKIVLENGNDFCLVQFRMRRLPEPNAFEANLDFDFIDKSETTIEPVFKETLVKLNNQHYDLFMWAITEDLIKLMEN